MNIIQGPNQSLPRSLHRMKANGLTIIYVVGSSMAKAKIQRRILVCDVMRVESIGKGIRKQKLFGAIATPWKKTRNNTARSDLQDIATP